MRIFSNCRVAALLCSVACLSSVQAQDSNNQYEYPRLIKSAEAVGALGPGLMGDQTNFYTGSTSFSAVDVSIQGNNSLPVSVGRSLSVQDKVIAGRYGAFADWDLDVPHLSATFVKDLGWQVDRPSNRDARCTVSDESQAVAPMLPILFAQGVLQPDVYWHGFSLHQPGGGAKTLLHTGGFDSRTQSASPYYWSTNNNWKLSCLSTAANSVGESFVALSPDGTSYRLDWFARQPVVGVTASPTSGGTMKSGDTTKSSSSDSDSKSEPTPTLAPVGNSTFIQREQVDIYPTLVTDRFGNTVVYTWNPTKPGQLTKILSSDGRQIDLTYNAAGYVATVTDGTRTWSYGYTGSSLTSVTLPDTSKWLYSLASLSGMTFNYTNQASCANSGKATIPANAVMGTVTHPSGAVGQFGLKATWHGRSYVAGKCAQINPNGGGGELRNPINFTVASLVSKQISGPGLVSSAWTYVYGPGNASWAEDCTPTSCAKTKTVSVTGPSDFTRYTFGNQSLVNEGKLLTTERGTSAMSILTTETLTYQLDPANQSYLGNLGALKVDRTDDTSYKYTPVVQRTTQQQGVAFDWKVASTSGVYSFDTFANPVTLIKSSTGGSGGAFTRTETMAYENNMAKWVIGQVKSVTVGAQVVSQTDFDQITVLPQQTYSFGLMQQTLAYNPDGTLATVKDGRNNITSLGNWYRGVPRLITYADSTTRSATVNPIGALLSTTDELGSTSTYSYDTMGRLTGITYPTGDTAAWNGKTSSFTPVMAAEYGIAAGHWKAVANVGNARTTTFYDAQWRPVVALNEDTANPASKSFVVNRYDAAGRLIFTSYPVGNLTSVNDTLKGVVTSYDALDRVTQVQQDAEATQPLLTTTTAYLTGFQAQVTNPRGKVTTTSYQTYDTPSTDSPVQIQHPAGVTTTITRQLSLSKPLSVQRAGTYNGSPLSHTRSFVYDANERLCKTINPESSATLVSYDAAGNVDWSADGLALWDLICDRDSVALGDKTTRTYDARNRVTAVATPGGTADVATTYYPDGAVNTVTAANPGGYNVQTSYGYNKRRLLTSESSTNGATLFNLGYGYNPNGHVLNMTYPDGQVVGYAPDALGRTTQVAAAGGQVYANAIGYYPTGAISGFTYGNSIVHGMTPNSRQLTARSFDKFGGTTYLDDTYAYDANGNVDYVTDALPVSATSHTRDMGYDDLDRLIVADSPDAVWGHATYSYDPIDNLRSVDIASMGGVASRAWRYVYGGGNRLRSIRSTSDLIGYAIDYDARGNTTSKAADAVNCAAIPQLQCAGKPSQAMVFDSANRLSQVTGVQTYRYDGLGRRVQTTDADGKTTFWMYSQSGQVIYSSEARRNQNISYIYLGNTQVATRSVAWGTGTTAVRYQHTDALGSPVVETDASRNVIKRNVFSPWGEAWGTTVVDGTGYTGHVMDQGTGLTYMQQRYYDPAIGRTLSVDPVTAYDTGDYRYFNRYVYAFNNPYKFTDPDGRCPNCLAGGVGAGVGLIFGLAVEGYRQYQAGEFDGAALAIEGGKGALVGGLTGFTGGAIGASALSVPAKIAATGGSAFAIGAGGDAAGAVASGNAPTVRGAVVAGSANMVGSAIGAIAKPAATAAATTTTAAVKSHPVTSLTGRVFYTVNTPASSSTNRAAAESIQSTAGETASSSTSAAEKKLREN